LRMDSQARRNMANFIISSLAGELDTGSHVESMRRFEIIRALRLLISQASLADKDQACSILQIILKDLNIEPIQPCIGNEALQALASVTHYLDATSTNRPPQRLMRILEDAWPQVFQWLWSQIFTLTLPPVSSDDATLNSYYYSAAISVLSLYSSYPILFHVATEADLPLDLLVSRLWYIRAKRLDPSIPSAIVHLYRTYLSPQKSAPDPNSQCAALGVASSFHMLYTNFQWRDSDRDVLHSAISSTIQLLLHAPRAELSAKTPDLALVESHLAIIVALSHAEKHPYAFINNHSPSVIVKLLMSLGNFSANDAFLAKCTSLCVEHLCLVLESSPGFQPILEALDAMLLPALIKLHSRLPQLCSLTPAQHDAPSLLCNILSKYLIFISFRERVAKSLSIIAKTELENLLPKDSPFTTAWIDFKELSMKRSKVITQPHRGRAKNEIVCSNITCRETKQKADLACCSRCHVAFYCSKACQVYDWKHGDHKATCVGAYDRRKNFPIGNRDMFSVDELVRSEVKLKLSEICAAWEDLSQDCIVPLVIFDLVTHPLSLTITKADPDVPPHRRTTARQTVFWKETVEMVDAERKRGVNKGILLAYIPAGAECYHSMVMITLDELRTVVFSSKPMFGLGPATVSVG
ncbi:hypothetical protein R3P38DRAFT_2842040, partial [Favolaschia claudopus]